jgi:hypothetical protein
MDYSLTYALPQNINYNKGTPKGAFITTKHKKIYLTV